MGTHDGQNGAAPAAMQRPSRVEGRLERDTKDLFAAIERLSDDASSSLRDQVDRHPYTSLGLGLLGGYVLGRGLTFTIGTGVLSAAWRAALTNLVARGITSARGRAARDFAPTTVTRGRTNPRSR